MTTAGKNQKVNLSDIKGKLVKRGKPPYENPTLKALINEIDPTDPDDAFIWDEATVNLNQEQAKVQKDKMRFRNRAESIAEQLEIEIQINWLDNGQMVISRKANA
jgi:hypothetical protein